jgi:uncharacterized sulfatase
MGPHLGCYGDTFATSPNLDRFAQRSLRYRHVWSNAPVCAPARTTIISGVYPPATGSEHMRSMTSLPANMVMFPVLLRRLGYYCSNWIKEDYNLQKTGKVWDDSSKSAHYKNRAKGQPFFAVFNFTITHESQIRTRPHKWVHDVNKVPIPAYHPDTIEVRQDWAQYYDNIAAMDKMVGKILQELEEAGLANDTIVFFYSDHGSGMPRNKRTPADSGLHVPLLVHVPDNWKHLAPKDYKAGGTTDRLVSFVDLAPTVLSLAGEKAPAYFQGKAFMGKYEAEPNKHLFGFRGRMDERYDFMRSARDERFVYVRNYLPHKPAGQHNEYMFQTPTTKVWKKLFDEGKLSEAQSLFWKTPRPAEELYDLRTDPFEVKNLADHPDMKETLGKLREALTEHMARIRDLGFLPEDEIHTRSKGSTPYEMGHHKLKYSFGLVHKTADAASRLGTTDLPAYHAGLKNGDSAVRYWSAQAIRMRGQDAVAQSKAELLAALKDPAPSVAIVAGEALGIFGSDAESKQAIDVLLKWGSGKEGTFVTLQALNALQEVGPKAAYGLPIIKMAGKEDTGFDARVRLMPSRVVAKIVADWERK